MKREETLEGKRRNEKTKTCPRCGTEMKKGEPYEPQHSWESPLKNYFECQNPECRVISIIED